jgi:hypothetical protein
MIASVMALVGAILPNVDMLPVEALMELGTHRHLQALMSNMTAEVALATPPAMPAALKTFINKQLGAGIGERNSQVFLQAHTTKSTKMESELQLDLATMDADKARVVLNKMAKDTMAKLDMQRVECLSQQSKQKQLLDETGQDVSSFNAQGTTARAQLMATQTAIKRLEEMIPKLSLELSLHDSKCKESRVSLKKQIELVQKDASTLSSVSNMASCSSLLQTGLLHCHKHHKGRGHSFVAFRHSALRHKVAQLKLAKSRQALQTVLLEVAVGRHRRHHGKHARSGRSRRERQHRHRRHRHMKVNRHKHHRHSRSHGHKHLTLLSQGSKTRTASSVNG